MIDPMTESARPSPTEHRNRRLLRARDAMDRDLLTKGALGTPLILTTDDGQAEYERLSALGVEFTEKPTEQFYGIDSALRDPFGNHIRITQVPDSAE